MRRNLFFLLVFGVAMATNAARAEDPKRLALLIGNQGYTEQVGRLKNPHNDVDLIEASLKRLNFKVTVLKDANYKTIDIELKRYVTAVRRAGTAAVSFFYYSGHGVANPETQMNYLIPVDVTDASTENIWYESFQQSKIIDMLAKQAPSATHYVVFDACRNELKLAGVAAKAVGTQKGFVPVHDTFGLLVAYSTAPKETASDVGVGSGPYAKVLAEELLKPGVEAVSMFRNVQLKVKASIGQDPWLSFPSLPAVYLAGNGNAQSSPTASRPLEPSRSEIAQLCQSVAAMTSQAVVRSLLETYKGTPMERCAAARLDELQKIEDARKQAVTAPTPPVPRPSEESETKRRVEAERPRLESERARREEERARVRPTLPACPDKFSAFRGSSGELSCHCAMGALKGYVWGTDTYTDDSSICAAARHAGVVADAGGPVRLRAAGGRSSYQGSTRNAVSSSNWQQWDGSFVFTTPIISGSTTSAAPSSQAACPADAKAFRGSGQKLSCHCPAEAITGTIWGSGVYTDDSSICLAAVHSGVIGKSGGTVSMVALPGQASYPGSTMNGVKALSYDRWHGSFRFEN